jgi:hypothetical protein
MVKLVGVKLGKSFQIKDGKIAKQFIPRDASQRARWAKQPKTIKVARHQRRGT